MADQPGETKEQTHQRYYAAFHAWFMANNCDFWSECDAPESLATLAVDIADRMCAAARREGELAMRERCAQYIDRSARDADEHGDAEYGDHLRAIGGSIRALEPETKA